MKDINTRYRTTFIFSTHDKKVMVKADRLVRIEDGRVYQLGLRTADGWTFVRTRQGRNKDLEGESHEAAQDSPSSG